METLPAPLAPAVAKPPLAKGEPEATRFPWALTAEPSWALSSGWAGISSLSQNWATAGETERARTAGRAARNRLEAVMGERIDQ